MTPERRFWDSKARSHLNTYGAFERVETSTIPGFPDVVYTVSKCTGMMELKIVEGNPGNYHLYMRKYQVPFMKRHLVHGAMLNFWLLGYHEDFGDLLLIRADRLLAMPRRATGTDFQRVDIAMGLVTKRWENGRHDWAELVSYLVHD